MPRTQAGLRRLTPIPRFQLPGELPQWIISSPKAAYTPRYNSRAPMTIWIALDECEDLADFAVSLAHEYGHFLVDWATCCASTRTSARWQHRYDAWWAERLIPGVEEAWQRATNVVRSVSSRTFR